MSISDKLEKKKAAIYIRVSTRYQVDRDSLQVQRRELTVYSEMVLGIPDYASILPRTFLTCSGSGIERMAPFLVVTR